MFVFAGWFVCWQHYIMEKVIGHFFGKNVGRGTLDRNQQIIF